MGRVRIRRLLIAAAITLVLVLAASWIGPSSSYLFLPNPAKPLAEQITVKGAKPPDDRGGIYYVDITIRRATWLERYLAFTRPDGASLVSERVVVPPGSSFSARHTAELAEMGRSERTAAAVALRAAGYKVRARPRGALIEGVAFNAPSVGKLRDGDVIVEAAGMDVRTPAELREAVGTVKPGEAIALRVRREGKTLDLTVTTMPAPGEPARPVLGIFVSQAADIDLPIPVNIDLGDVGGPSAGLPFALGIMQKLGRDVDRGYRVAATGEIELNGAVGAIGGIKQKVFGAKAAGADVFLVPSGDNANEARRYAGNLRVIAVDNFQQALRKLATLPHR
jgi:PDZ domain-containing protein